MAVKRWKLLLAGTDRRRALETVRSILSDFDSPDGVEAATACDHADRAVVLAEAGRVMRVAGQARKLDSWIARAYDELPTDRSLIGIISNFLGVGHDIECVRSLGHTSWAGSTEIDRVLLESFARPAAAVASFDVLYGFAAWAIYALSRLPRVAARAGLEQLVRRLEERAEPSGRGLAWRTPRKPGNRIGIPGSVFDVGAAHGAAGVLAVLAKLHERGISPTRTRRLLRRGVDWLVDQRRQHPGSRFAACIHDDYRDTPVRTAWCYGDLGVAVCLLSAARALGDDRLAAISLEIARESAQRPFEDTGVVDASLCHGSAGVAHLFHRLYQATGDETLREAAVSWCRRTLDYRGDRPGAGFVFYVPVPGETGPDLRPDRTFLMGTAGVALALVSACAEHAPVWDRRLAIDVARARPRRRH
jgi:hypothetical protein